MSNHYLMIKKVALFFGCMFLYCFQVFSQIKINEYSVSNSVLTTGTTFSDNLSNTPDWIEFYNTGTATIDLSGWNLSDNPNNLTKYALPSGTTISPGAFLRIWCSGKGNNANAAGHIHTTFKLTQCKGDWIVLSNAGFVVDSLQLRKTQAAHSRGRTPDGANVWKVYTTPTPNSTNIGASYIDYVSTPQITPNAGFYGGAQAITVSTPSAGVSIYYTTDGSEPTTGSTLYSSAVNISSTSVFRAYAVTNDPNYLPSFMETNTYLINESINSQYGVVSISGGGPLNSLMGGTQNNPRTHFEYFDNNAFITETYGLSNKHGNDSWAYDQRGIDFETKDDYGYNNALKHKFFTNWKQGASSRKEFQHVILKAAASDNYSSENNVGKPSCHMRDAFVQTYAFRKGLDLDGRRNKHVIAFVNGQYWGLYELREAFETDYTEYYYDQPKDSIDNLAYWGSLQIRDGSDTGWVNLYNFVMNNSMTNVANYSYVDSKLSFKSLVDYMIYNSYVVNSDFINWNSAWWRGRAITGNKKKWRYWMWDMDNVYDLGENFSGLPTTDMNSSPCDYTNVFQNAGPNEGHPDILEKLLTNPQFKSFYINRYADLLNTAFKCDSIMDHFNHFKNILTPEMPRQIAKWGGTLAEWNKNMDTLQSKIQRRCSFIESKITDCYNVSGPHQITVDVDPPGVGNVKVNTIWLNNFQWTGKYFGGVTMTFKEAVIDTANYEFDYWEFQSHSPSPSINNDSVSINISAPDNIIAHFVEKNSDAVFPTAFTPNNDGNNDILLLQGLRYVKSATVEIWNRWGQLVFSSSDPKVGWDGNFQGTPAQTGVYAYLIKYVNSKNEEKYTKGNVTLLR